MLYCFFLGNRFVIEGRPTNELLNKPDQLLTSPFFPQLYPSDLSNEYVVKCESKQPCRISLLFTDFMIADSSILEVNMVWFGSILSAMDSCMCNKTKYFVVVFL